LTYRDFDQVYGSQIEITFIADSDPDKSRNNRLKRKCGSQVQ